MKILHVTKKYPNALGGDAVVVSNLEKQQKEHGHTIVILTSNCDEIKSSKTIYKFGLKDTSAALDTITIRRLVSLVMLFFKAFKVLRNERPDVVHTHSIDMAFFISFAARFYRVPIIHTFHSVTFYGENQTFVRRNTELLFARGANPRIVTAPNAYDVQKLREVGLNTVELPNGIDLDFWKYDPKLKKSKKFTFVTVGRIEEQKGNEYLIKAAARLRKITDDQFKVVLVGSGSYVEQLKSLVASLGLDTCVEFTGRKTPTETRKLYNSSQAAVFASLYETTPLTLLEAWAMRLPVITTRVGILQAIKHTDSALLVKLRDDKTLADAMYRLMADTKLGKQLTEKAHRKVQAYDWPVIYGTVEKIYGDALNQKHDAPRSDIHG